MKLSIQIRRRPGVHAGIGRGATARALGLAVAVVLLASLLVPLSQPVSVAAEPNATEETTALPGDGESGSANQDGQGDGGSLDGTPTAEETPPVEETPATETPVPDQTPASEEMPVAEETPDTEHTVDGEEPQTISVDVRATNCSSDYGGDFQQLRDNCDVPIEDEGSTIELWFDGALVERRPGSLSADNLRPGEYVVRVEALQGFGPPLVFCRLDPLEADYRPVTVANGSYTFELSAGQSMYCRWFNVPDPENPDSSRVDALVLECASDYGGDYQQLRANCRPATTIGVELYFGGARRAIDQEHLDVRALPAGKYIVREIVPPGYGQPLGFCGTAPTGEDKPALTPVALNGDSYEFTLDANETIWCQLFSVRQGNISAYMVAGICPAGTDPAGTMADLAAACHVGQQGVQVMVYQSNHPVGTAVTGSEGSGVGFDSLPGSGLSFLVKVQDGYRDVAVFCNRFGADGTATGYQRVNNVDSDGAFFSIDVSLLPGEFLSCDWFQIAEPTRLTIYAYVCPAEEGFDYYTAKEEEIASRCTAYEGTEATFDLTSDATARTETRSTTSEGGSAYGAYWNPAPTGPVTVTEHAWQGYGRPLVYCGVAYQDGIEFFDVKVSGWSADFKIFTGETVLCFWYNVPAGEVDIYITKHDCPADFAGDYADLSDLYAACPGMDDVKFTVHDKDGGELASGVTAGDLGEVAFEDLPAGKVTIVEPYLDGYGPPVVFCRLTDAGGQQTDYQPELVVSGDGGHTISRTLDGGEALACKWFNLPDYNEVWIVKYFCPEDDEVDYYAADSETLKERCEPYEGAEVGFDFSSHATGRTTTRYTDPAFGGNAWWDKAPVGPMTVTEHAQEGYGRPVVQCGYSAGNGFDPFPVEVDGWSIEFDVPSWTSGKLVSCSWFNIPAARGSVTVVKYDCPDGTGHDEGWYDRYEASCIEPAEGVVFKLDGASTGNPGDRETDASGVVSWGDREADHYHLYEELPSGYRAPVVYCSFYYPLDEHPPAWEEYDPEHTLDADPFDYRIAFDLVAGQHAVCAWFNLPEDDRHDDRGIITVIKYWCDGDRVTQLACELYGGGQDFVLRSVIGGQAIELTTGANGKASVEVPAGAWELVEVGGRWCKATSDHVGRSGYLISRPGRETVVKVYNCGDNPPTKQPPTELPNTGSGPMPDVGAPAGWGDRAARVEFPLAAGELLGLVSQAIRRSRRRGPADLLAG